MWFRKVTAGAFGHLRGKALSFGRSLNIVYGPNESGKSTWHAALTVALCGQRHGSGRTNEERDFKRRRQPWDDPEGWAVTLEAELDDGRIVEIDRDLNAPRATILDISMGGREITDDLMNQGSPDGAKWLGLDRTTFPITASVGQGNILAVVEEPEALQEHLARAATGGAGETAAGAIERIENYEKENIGLDRRNARRPLRLALNAVEEAKAELSRVLERRREYLNLASAVDENRRKVDRLEHRLAVIEALMDWENAERQANDLDEQANRLEEWQKEFSDGDPQARELLSSTELAVAINGARNALESVVTDLEPLEILEARMMELRRQKALVEALGDVEKAESRADDLDREAERLAKWCRWFPDGDPQARELTSFTDLASAITRCRSLPAPAPTDLDPVENLEKCIALFDDSSPKPCPRPGHVQQLVVPLREPAPPTEGKLQAQIEEARKEKARSGASSMARKSLVLAVIAVFAAGAVVGITTKVIYGALVAGFTIALLAVLQVRSSKPKSASSVDIELLEKQLEERRAYDARITEVYRVLQEWELPKDADEAVAESYERERARIEESAERARLEGLIGQRRLYDEEVDRRRDERAGFLGICAR